MVKHRTCAVVFGELEEAMIPESAKLEAVVSPRVALYDVSHLLPVGPGHYKNRDVSAIERLYMHKSGADGPAGFKGALGMATFCTNTEWGRGWPGAPYHFWASRNPDIDPAGRFVCYRTQRDEVRSYHTGGDANGHGLGFAVQGNYDGEWDLLGPELPRIERAPSPEAMIIVEDMVAWIAKRYVLEIHDTWLSGHWEAARFGGKNKPVCPGDALRQWVLRRRRGAEEAEVVTSTRPVLPPIVGELDVRQLSHKDLQRALSMLGFSPGVVDGVFGYRSRAALERFQKAVGLEADGWFGPRTATALLKALRSKGLSHRDVFDGRVQKT
jgi:hypothetical protein